MDPGHGCFSNRGRTARFWEAEGEVVADDGTKVGCKQGTTIKEIPVVKPTSTQRAAFAVLVSLEVCQEPNYVTWANRWLENKDRSREAAQVTARAVARAFGTGVVAEVAIRVAAAAADAATPLTPDTIARCAAQVAVNVATAIEATGQKIDFVGLAKKAMTYT